MKFKNSFYILFVITMQSLIVNSLYSMKHDTLEISNEIYKLYYKSTLSIERKKSIRNATVYFHESIEPEKWLNLSYKEKNELSKKRMFERLKFEFFTHFKYKEIYEPIKYFKKVKKDSIHYNNDFENNFKIVNHMTIEEYVQVAKEAFLESIIFWLSMENDRNFKNWEETLEAWEDINNDFARLAKNFTTKEQFKKLIEEERQRRL